MRSGDCHGCLVGCGCGVVEGDFFGWRGLKIWRGVMAQLVPELDMSYFIQSPCGYYFGKMAELTIAFHLGFAKRHPDQRLFLEVRFAPCMSPGGVHVASFENVESFFCRVHTPGSFDPQDLDFEPRKGSSQK
ncbi:hypothetical protein Tco_1345096 [Tanacetum coccineum]